MQKITAIILLVACCVAAFASQDRAVTPVLAVPEKAFPKAQQPQLAVDPAGKVHLVFGAGNAIYCTTTGDGGATFVEPVKVGEVGSLALGMRRGPRIVATDKAVIVSAIGGPLGRGRDEDLLAWRSNDGGKSWQGPVKINGVGASAREGMHHMTVAPDGTIYCVWLDLRNKKTEVYGAKSIDGGATWHDERAIYQSPDGSVCECCQPQAAYDPRGRLHVMWRNNLAGARDMYLCSSEDHGKTFAKAKKLGQGTWPLKACPMDGGALAGNLEGAVMSIWMRDKELFRSAPELPEESLGKGQQGWAAAGPGGFYLVWITDRPGQVMALLPGSEKKLKVADSGWDPVVASPATGKGPVVMAWEEGKAGAKRIYVTVLAR